MSIYFFLAFGLLFSNLTQASSRFEADKKLIISGYGKNRVHRDLRTPIFVSDEGSQIRLAFKSRLPWSQWQNLTKRGRIHLTLIGSLQKDGFISVVGVDPYFESEDRRTSSLNSIRYDAQLAWQQTKSAMLAQSALATQPLSTLPILMLGHQVQFQISVSSNKNFLNALIAVGKLVVRGMSTAQISFYVEMIHEVLALTEESEIRIYRESLRPSDCCELRLNGI